MYVLVQDLQQQRVLDSIKTDREGYSMARSKVGRRQGNLRNRQDIFCKSLMKEPLTNITS